MLSVVGLIITSSRPIELYCTICCAISLVMIYVEQRYVLTTMDFDSSGLEWKY